MLTDIIMCMCLDIHVTYFCIFYTSFIFLRTLINSYSSNSSNNSSKLYTTAN